MVRQWCPDQKNKITRGNMKQNLVAIAAMALLLVPPGCGSKEKKTSHPAGITTVVQHSVDISYGDYTTETFYNNGKWFKSIGHFKNGNRFYETYVMRNDTTSIIQTTSFYPSGNLLRTEMRVNNEVTMAQSFHENGQLSVERNVPAGYERAWNEDGKPFFENNDLRTNNRTIYSWYANGQMKELFELSGGERNGKWFEWDSLGNQTRSEMYVNGKRKK